MDPVPLRPLELNAFLADLVRDVRSVFGGPVGYCSLPFEKVDWAPLDWVATDAGHRSTEDDTTFRAGIRALRGHGKPAAVTEFGCTTHRGAAVKGGHGGDIVLLDGVVPVALDDDYRRDEQEQADYLLRQLAIFESEGLDAAFVYTFANFHLPRRSGHRRDLDLASAGIVAVHDPGGRDVRWTPKAAFEAYARYTPAASRRPGAADGQSDS